jgi:cystathionine gamma-synthase
MLTGAVPGTMEAWLGLRGMRTLPLRVGRGVDSAALLARRLEDRLGVGPVRYPGLPSHPAHRTAARLLDGFGAVISFEVEDARRADAICEAVEVIVHASSLGGVETLIERQARWHAEPSVPDGLLRLSVGCEDPEDLWRDLERAIAV